MMITIFGVYLDQRLRRVESSRIDESIHLRMGVRPTLWGTSFSKSPIVGFEIVGCSEYLMNIYKKIKLRCSGDTRLV